MAVRALCAWESLVSAFGLGRYKTDEYMFDAYWKTMMAGRLLLCRVLLNVPS